MADMTLRELCTAYGVTRRAVQGFERMGLARATGRNSMGHLLYNEDAQKMVGTIKQYQNFGFSLKQIQELLRCPDAELKKRLIAQREVLKVQHDRLSVEIKCITDMINTLM